MDDLKEQHDAAAIEAAIPDSTATVEEINTPSGPVEVAIVEPEPPKDELEVGYRYGQLEARMRALEEAHERAMSQLSAFEQATIAAVEAEAAELETQGEVVADLAEEVLPPDSETAAAHNPDHSRVKIGFWDRLLGGH